MKKKVIGALFSLAFAVCFTACTNQAVVDTGMPAGGESVESTAENEKDGREEQGGTDAGSEDKQAGEDKEKDQNTFSAGHLLWRGYDTEALYRLSDGGTAVEKIPWDEYLDAFAERGYDFRNFILSYASGTVVYLYQYEQTGDAYVGAVYAVDYQSGEVARICELDPQYSINDIDVYQGRVSIVSSKYAADGYQLQERIFEREGDLFSFQEKEDPYESFLQGLIGLDSIRILSPNANSMEISCGIERAMDEVGFIIGRKDNAFFRFFGDGSAEQIEGISAEKAYIITYDQEYFIYSVYDEDWNPIYAWMDLRTGDRGELKPEDGAVTYLAYEDGKLYFSEREEKGFIYQTNSVYQYDLKNGSERKLYEMSTVPGASTVLPGTQWFQVINGKVYFEGVDGDTSRWFCMDADGSENSCRPIGDAIKALNALRYGTVDYRTYSSQCPFCGIALGKYYGEAFCLDAGFSANAEKINKQLKEELDGAVEAYQGRVEGYERTDEDCESHLEYPDMWCETEEYRVRDVRIFHDKYLAVDMDGYWYGGGAHGQPFMGQRIFDLESGQEMTLQDFYKGTEEEFRKLVAEKTREDFESYDPYTSPYYSDDADTVYTQAYESTGFEYTQVIFDEDCAYIVYQPYDMGPFASGFIEVQISYEELLGRSEL